MVLDADSADNRLANRKSVQTHFEARLAKKTQLLRSQSLPQRVSGTADTLEQSKLHLRPHGGSQEPFGLWRIPQHDEAAAGCTCGDIQPQVEHGGVELEHLVEVAEKQPLRWHSSSHPVKREVFGAVPESGLRQLRGKICKRTLHRGSQTRGVGARRHGL